LRIGHIADAQIFPPSLAGTKQDPGPRTRRNRNHGEAPAAQTQIASLSRVGVPSTALNRAIRLQRLDQFEVFQTGGVQRIGQDVHILAELDQT
jgi:hypothetical protein